MTEYCLKLSLYRKRNSEINLYYAMYMLTNPYRYVSNQDIHTYSQITWIDEIIHDNIRYGKRGSYITLGLFLRRLKLHLRDLSKG